MVTLMPVEILRKFSIHNTKSPMLTSGFFIEWIKTTFYSVNL